MLHTVDKLYVIIFVAVSFHVNCGSPDVLIVDLLYSDLFVQFVYPPAACWIAVTGPYNIWLLGVYTNIQTYLKLEVITAGINPVWNDDVYWLFNYNDIELVTVISLVSL